MVALHEYKVKVNGLATSFLLDERDAQRRGLKRETKAAPEVVSETPVVPAVDPADEKPADEKPAVDPADEKPADEKPDEKAAEAPANKSRKPAANK